MPYYRDIIKEAVADAGLSPLRADEVYGTSAIIQDIWNQIWRARIVVADVTGLASSVVAADHITPRFETVSDCVIHVAA
jgi:hypothetical protein